MFFFKSFPLSLSAFQFSNMLSNSYFYEHRAFKLKTEIGPCYFSKNIRFKKSKAADRTLIYPALCHKVTAFYSVARCVRWIHLLHLHQVQAFFYTVISLNLTFNWKALDIHSLKINNKLLMVCSSSVLNLRWIYAWRKTEIASGRMTAYRKWAQQKEQVVLLLHTLWLQCLCIKNIKLTS